MGEFIRENLPDPIDYFESQGLILKGQGPWRTTKCNFHGGSDSMRVMVSTGAWRCMSCAVKGGNVLDYHMEDSGLGFVAAAKELGAWNYEGSAPKQYKKERIPASKAILILAFESNLAAVAAGNAAKGVILSDVDRMRLCVAASRIQHIAGDYQ